MKILITGGAGFIGSHLTAYHLKKLDEVYVIDNLLTGSERNLERMSNNPNFHFIKEDVSYYDFSKLSRFDIVYHMACPASPVQYKKYPVETLLVMSKGTHNVLEFVRNSQSQIFALTSTSEVYGDPLVHPQTENYWGNVNPVGVRSCYDEGKRFAEALTMAYFRKYKLDVRIARIFNTYGPYMEKNDGRVISNFVNQAISNQPITIFGDGNQTRSFCFVSDMVDALYSLSTAKNIGGEIINLGNPIEKSVTDIAEIIKKMTDSTSLIIHEPIDTDDPKKRKPNIDKAKKLLGWEPKISLETGLLKTIEYFKTC